MIQLKSAFFWSCPECNNHNFLLAEEAELGDTENLTYHFETTHELDGEEPSSADFLVTRVLVAPKEVFCKNCYEMFESELEVNDQEI